MPLDFPRQNLYKRDSITLAECSTILILPEDASTKLVLLLSIILKTALSAQNNLVTRKDLILTQDFDVAKFILQENLHSMTLFHKFSKYESFSYKSLKRSVLFPFCNVWCWAWSPQIWVLKYQRSFLSHCNQKGNFFQTMIR